MQIMDRPPNGRRRKLALKIFSRDMIYDPKVNIEIGCWYIAKLLEDNDGELVNAIAAYNAGDGNLRQWQKELDKKALTVEEIPFADTRTYVKKVLGYYENYQKIYRD